MKDRIEEILRDYQDRESRASLAFFLCFNILELENKYSSGEIRKAVYDALDMLGVEEWKTTPTFASGCGKLMNQKINQNARILKSIRKYSVYTEI